MYAKLPEQVFREDLLGYTNDAKLLHLASLCRCAALLTDGWLVPHNLNIAAAEAGVDGRACALELVEGGLWVWEEGAHYLPTYLRDNPSREKAVSKGYVRSEAGRLGGLKSGHTRRSKREAIASPNAVANGEANREANGEAHPEATRAAPPTRGSKAEAIASPDASIMLQNGHNEAETKQLLHQLPKQELHSTSPSSSISPSASTSKSARALSGAPPVEVVGEGWRGQRAAFEQFQHDYPRLVPEHLWPLFVEVVQSRADWQGLCTGLNLWIACDQWAENPSRYATNPQVWLSEQRWTRPPRPPRRGTNVKSRTATNDDVAAGWSPGSSLVSPLDDGEDQR